MHIHACKCIYVHIESIYHSLVQFNNTMIWLCSLCMRKPSYFSCLSLTICPHKYDSTLSLSHTGKSLGSPKFSCYLSKPNIKLKSFTYMCFLIYLPHFWNISAVAHHMPLRYRKWFQYVFKSMICRYILVFLESSKPNGDNSPVPAEDTCIGTRDFLTHNNHQI